MRPDSSSATNYLQHRPLLTTLQARLLGIGAPLLIALLGVGLADTDKIRSLNDITIDWRFRARGPLPVRSDIVVVQLDEDSRQTLKAGKHRFELRRHLPDAIDRLADAGALVIGIDTWFEDLGDPQVDARLADAIGGANVLLGVAHSSGRTKRAPALFLESLPPEGIITVYPDPDGVLRRLPPESCIFVPGANGQVQRIPHFPIMAALFGVLERDPDADLHCENFATRLGSRTIAGRSLVDYASLDLDDWATLTFADVVHGRFDPEVIDGAIVLIGESRKIRDRFPMPLSRELVPGVYYHANVVAQILDDRWFAESPAQGSARRWLIAGLGLVSGFFAWNQRHWWQHRHSTPLLMVYLGVGIVVFLGGWSYVSAKLFEHHILVPVAGPLAAMSLSLGSGLAAQWVILSAETRRLMERARRIEALLGQSVSHAVLEAVKHDPEQIMQTRVREVSVLFCDLRGFTATAGKLDPREVADLLNEYFNHITSAIFENDGFIDKFVGDEVMAVFSVPLAQPDHPLRAVRTAISIKRHLAELNRRRKQRGQLPLVCGIGIHTGPAAAGHIGSRDRSNYTVVGHTINLAARIEGFTTGGEILISEALYDCLADQDLRMSFWKQVEIRGDQGRHNLYQVEVL
ncbi:MAG: adenylate/guanylate cyclase domain-containing protein [Phycisphaerae bacterium]|nr:adenylate/guanylate cyclase domain-containing protein [Phycisphaerae bacterium]